MSLINCPECGKSISDKANCCIHCGYPLENNAANNQNYLQSTNPSLDVLTNKITTFNMIVEHKNEPNFFLDAVLELENVYNCQNARQLLSIPGSVLIEGIEVANIGYIKKRFLAMGYVMDFIPSDDGYINPINSKIETIRLKRNSYEERSNPLACPRCGSTSVAIGQKGFSILSGFWGSNKTTNRCGSCGYTWQPKR